MSETQIPIKQLVENSESFYPLTSANAVLFDGGTYLSSKPFATGVLTINVDGSQVGTFSASGANNQSVNIQTGASASLNSLVASASYNSNTKKIEFFNSSSTKLCDIDASAFIVDGMIDSVSIGNGTGANAGVSCLLIDFNTDAESSNHTDIQIPLSQIFNPDNYYTKTVADETFVKVEEYNDDTMVISAALNDLNGRVATAESEIAGFSGGDENIIETVKVNGTALTVTDKAVDVTVPTTLASLTDDSTHRLVTDTEKTKLQGIAAGAEVNVQSDWSVTDSTSDAYIVNKPTIPTKVSDLTNDSGFITNAGVTSFNGSTGAITYTPPVTSVNGNTGAVTVSVPTKVSDLTNDSGFITGYTETDPVFSASVAHGITSSDITNWNSKTSNVGTITGITMNGSSKGTSGVVNLGTVLTSHQDISGKENTSNKVTSLSSSSTDTEYPSAKAVYDAIQNSGSDDSEHAVKIDSTYTVNVSNASSTRIFSLSDVKYAGCAIHMINTSQFFGYGEGDIVFGISNSTGDTYLAFVQYRDNESTTIKFVLSVNGTITQSSNVGNVVAGTYSYLSNLRFTFDFAIKQAFFTYKYGASTAISSANFSSWDLSNLSTFKFVVTTSASTAVAQISVNDLGWNLTPYDFSCEYGHYNVGSPTSYSDNIYLAGTGITTSGTITQNISNIDKIISVSASEPTAFSLYPSNIVNRQDYSYYCLKIRFSSVSSGATIDSYYAGYWRPSYQDTGSLSNHTPVVDTDYYIGVFNPGDVNYMSDVFTITGDMTFEVSEPYYYNLQAQNICADTWNGNVFTGSIPFNSGKYPQNVFITKGIRQSTNTPTKYVPSGTIIVVSGDAYMYISGTWKQINNT